MALYESSDDALAMQLSDGALAQMLAERARTWPQETGGILVGRLSEDLHTAIVEEAWGPPADSEHARFGFRRGDAGVNAELDRRWKTDRLCYLGEWHTHPDGPPAPSDIDDAECRRPVTGCPEFLLVIVGGPLAAPRLSVNCYRHRCTRTGLFEGVPFGATHLAPGPAPATGG